MPGVHHAAFTGRFADLLRGKVLAMELDKEVGALLDARWAGIDHAKEPNLSYKPIIIRTPDDWPSVIVETRVSQTLPKLRLDAKWWIENSGREVKTAILIKIYRKTRRVFLEEWQYVTMRKPSTRRTPASTTSGPRRVQLVTINFPPGGRPVAGGPFTIGFRNLMLHDPRLPRPPSPPSPPHTLTTTMMEMMIARRVVRMMVAMKVGMAMVKMLENLKKKKKKNMGVVMVGVVVVAMVKMIVHLKKKMMMMKKTKMKMKMKMKMPVPEKRGTSFLQRRNWKRSLLGTSGKLAAIVIKLFLGAGEELGSKKSTEEGVA